MKAPARSKEIRRSVRAIRSSVRGTVHKSVLVRVNNICTLIEQTIPRALERGEDSTEMHVLARMATDYLPGALNPYLALPREFAERSPLSDGRTAIQSLCAQLDVMYSQVWQVSEDVLRADGDKLLANGRFLNDKFGHNPLNLPPQTPRQSTKQPTALPPLSQQILQAVSAHLMERMRSRKNP